MTDRFPLATAPQDTTLACKRRMTAERDTVQPTGTGALLQSAVEVRDNLRNSLAQVNDLIREVKAQRRQDRLLQNTMDSLRKLSIA